MDSASLGILVSGIVTVLTAFFGLLGVRERKTRDRATALEQSVEQLKERADEDEHRVDVCVQHIYLLRRVMAQHGIEPPPLPPELQYRPPPTEQKPAVPQT